MFLFRLLPVFWIAAMVFGCIMVGRSTLMHKKCWNGCVIAAGLVLWTLSGLLVYLVPFSSPEAAFIGMHSPSGSQEEELLTIEGDSSAYVLGNDSSQFVIKHGGKWKLAGLSTFSYAYSAHVDNISISVDGLRGPGDHYVCIMFFPASEECRIETPQNTVFYEKTDSDEEQGDFRSRTFYAYIGALNEDFPLTVNGNDLTIPKSAQINGPSRLSGDLLRLLGCVVLLVLGIVLVCFRVKRSGRKIAAIFGVILLDLFFGLLCFVYPLETAFITFDTPDDGFFYVHGNRSKLAVEGVSTSLLIGDYESCIVKKAEKGWKHPLTPEPETVYEASSQGISVTVYRDRASGECYLRIDTPKQLEHDILPTGRWFTYSEYPGAPSNAMAVLYGYLGKLESPFEITIDGVHFTIPEP